MNHFEQSPATYWLLLMWLALDLGRVTLDLWRLANHFA